MAAGNEIEQRKLALVQQMEEHRNSITGAKLLLNDQITSRKSALKEKLNVPKKIKQSIQEKSTKWLIGALASGTVMAFLGRRRSKRKQENKKKKSIFLTLLIALSRPFIKKYLVNTLRQYSMAKLQSKTGLPIGRRGYDYQQAGQVEHY
ncbi:hypothetical protein Rhal01_02333 [Rubritalea halochordaticola]|uniref:DUF3618 domain-containing protein n=1 Tax=Rubritalea halochordaticola TaxID=714537 RepID=A0ABP9V0C9_9BACT